MSELSQRRGRSGSVQPTIYCFCDSCERVLYVDPGELFCPVCSSPVMEVNPRDQISLPETSDSSAT